MQSDIHDPTVMFSIEKADPLFEKVQKCLNWQDLEIELHKTKYKVFDMILIILV